MAFVLPSWGWTSINDYSIIPYCMCTIILRSTAPSMAGVPQEDPHYFSIILSVTAEKPPHPLYDPSARDYAGTSPPEWGGKLLTDRRALAVPARGLLPGAGD